LKNVLVIRRDNIGDLVCTTPLLSNLRRYFLGTKIAVLANSYNAPVLRDHPDVDALYAYTKLKHKRPGQSAWSVAIQTLVLVWRLRRQKFDAVIIASSGEQASAIKYAFWIKPKLILTYDTPLLGSYRQVKSAVLLLDQSSPVVRRKGGIEIRTLPLAQAAVGHEAQAANRLIELIGVNPEQVPPVHIYAGADAVGRVSKYFRGTDPSRYRLAVHISARKASQRWPQARWIELIELLLKVLKVTVVLLWSPGKSSNPLHPGDDDIAKAIVDYFVDLPLVAVPTRRLDELIGALAHVDAMFCADGGAMHIAAGLGKPIVCMFGQSSPERWHPWGVEHTVLQADTLQAQDITVRQAVDAVAKLCPFFFASVPI